MSLEFLDYLKHGREIRTKPRLAVENRFQVYPRLNLRASLELGCPFVSCYFCECPKHEFPRYLLLART